ncbi:MAG TPA: tripartite tricarboxylate transporter substrate-binding protein [Beijerinckiaceae bacterium]|nr:tripartite tricarboxylate transporter substrate-binding protein [Beijerinckiaceae bacterium]
MRIVATAFALALGLSPAIAQPYPNKPISLVVPFAAGGPTDLIARLVGESMTKTLGQQIIVENIAGAGGTIGPSRVARAKPDGYTFLVHHVGLTTAATLYRKLDFDIRTAFQPVGIITNGPMILIAKSDFEPKDSAELVAFLRKNGEKVTFATAGLGSGSNLCGMLLEAALKVKLTTVPYRGTGPVMQDLRGKQVDMSCDQATNATQPVRENFVKAYAVTAPARLGPLPNIPTTGENPDLKSLDLNIWNALFAPKGTPPEIVSKVAEALRIALKEEKVVTRFKDLSTDPATPEQATPEALAKAFTAEIERWKPLIEASGQYAD